jgi:hypothetical protein
MGATGDAAVSIGLRHRGIDGGENRPHVVEERST